MKIKEALESGNYSLDAEVLLCHLLKKDKPWLYSHQDDILMSDRTRRYQKLISRRQNGEPVAYLTHSKEFFGLDFYVNESVLVPRPETELLVEEALKIRKKKAKILDVGTGSANIIISIGKNKKASLYASDISPNALRVAQKNAKKHKVKINFIKSDLFKNIPVGIKFDLIIANLPYLWEKFPQFEPLKALDGGRDGLKIIEKFLQEVGSYLSPKGIVLIEIDPRQVKRIKELSKKYLPHKKIAIKKDLAGLDRAAVLS